MKAELGAVCTLLLLRPIEYNRWVPTGEKVWGLGFGCGVPLQVVGKISHLIGVVAYCTDSRSCGGGCCYCCCSHTNSSTIPPPLPSLQARQRTPDADGPGGSARSLLLCAGAAPALGRAVHDASVPCMHGHWSRRAHGDPRWLLSRVLTAAGGACLLRLLCGPDGHTMRAGPAAQVLVDVFINYDCSLQASNLFERTIKALTKVRTNVFENTHERAYESLFVKSAPRCA